MEIRKFLNENKIVYTLNGESDTEGSLKLSEDIQKINAADVNKVIFDISRLQSLSLTLMRIFLICRKKEVSVSIRGADAEAEKRLKLVGFIGTDFEESAESEPDEGAVFWETAETETSDPEEDTDLALELGSISFADSFDPETTFREFLENKVLSVPKKVIIDQHGADYTWSDIDRISDIIASDLAGLGVKRGNHVGLCGMNSANWICTFFAIQKLGAMAVPVNAFWRPSEIARALNSCDATYLCYGDIPYDMSQKELIARITADRECSVAEFYDIGSNIDFRKWYGETYLIPKFNAWPDDPSVVIFTPGTSSVPNAALVSAQYLFTCAKRYALLVQQTPLDVSCQVLPLFHLSGLLQFLHVCLDDIPTCIPKSNHSGDVLEIINDKKCTVMHSVPNHYVALASYKSLKKYDISSLRVCMISEAGILPAHMQQLLDTFPETRFIKLYALSEMGMAAHTDYKETEEHLLKAAGHAAQDVQIRIISEDGAVCRQGEEGEILVKCFGYQSSVYYGRSFEKQPVDGEGFFHTGDTGYIGDDGYLNITGRKKEIIIRSGEKISPAEVAAVISSHPMAANVEVMGVPDEFYGEEVAAFIVKEDGAELNTDEIKAFAKERLASFKVPSYFIFTDGIPLLEDGKADRIALKTILDNYS